MNGRPEWRRFLPGAAFVVFAAGWYVANLCAYAASQRTLRAADARIVAAGHEPVFSDLPSVWQLQQQLRPALFGIIGAAAIAVLLRRGSKRPWFLFAGAVPVVLGHGEHLHGWWAPGAGIDQWTFGPAVGIPGLDLSGLDAGPSWTLAGGTLLAVAAVIVPALCLRRAPGRQLERRPFVQALPYVGLLAVATALAVGELHIDNTGDGSSQEMIVAGVGAALIALLAAMVAPRRWFWRDAPVTAIAVGLVTVSGLNPGAMFSTKLAAFSAAAGIAVIAACIARRPSLMRQSSHQGKPVIEPLTHP